MKYAFWVLLIMGFVFSSCSNSASVSGQGTDEIKKLVINPTATNPNITQGTDDYYVFTAASARAKDKLFIFLPGSLAGPKIYQQILRTGAESGYYSVGLSYQNGFTLTGQCRNEGPDCEGNLSREELEGKDFSALIDVNRASSFEGRIIALVQYMKQQQPDEDWAQFLNNGKIQWNKIIIAGHSQGGSHAAYIGWHRPVARVGMFSAPHNVANGQGEAQVSWLQDERKTPAPKFYGFGNTKDNVTDFDLQQGSWSAMGLAGPVISVDENEPSFDSSHQLSTSFGGNGILNGAHGSTAADADTPQDEDGNPSFAQVWVYMLFR